MATQTISALAFAGLLTVAIGVAAQTAPSREADVCVLPQADTSKVELAALFSADTPRQEQTLFSDAPLFIYAMNEAARDSDGVMLVDVNPVASCASHKNII